MINNRSNPLKKSYNLVAFPREGINIYDILVKKEYSFKSRLKNFFKSQSEPVNRIGTINSFFSNVNFSLPMSFKDKDCSSLKNTSTDILDFEASLEYKRHLLEEFGGNISSEVDTNKATKNKFIYTNIKSNEHFPAEINDFIQTAEPNYENAYWADLLGGNLYIIYEIIKTNSFQIEYYNDLNKKAEVDIKPIKESIEGGVMVMNTNLLDSKVCFNSKDKQVVIGFKAAQIFYEGRYYKLNLLRYNKLKEKWLPSELLNLLVPNPRVEYDNAHSFYEALKNSGISLADIQKYKSLFEICCGYEKFKLKDKGNLEYREAEFPISPLQTEKSFVDIEL